MRRKFLVVLVLIALATALALAIAKHPGYVLIAYDTFRFEASLWATLALLVLLIVALWIVRLVKRALLASAGFINPWSRKRTAKRANEAAHLGVLELTEGRWVEALKHLKQAAANQAQPLPYYLGAARAANELGQTQERDELLLQALERDPESSVAVGLTRARLLLDRADYTQARETLEDLHQQNERQAEVLKLLQQLYVHLKAWQPLLAIMPELRKHKVLPLDEVDLLEQEVWRARLASEEVQTSATYLAENWQRVPAHLRKSTDLLGLYAQGLSRTGQVDEAVKLLSKTISQHYDGQLVQQFGTMLSSDPALQLKKAEQWAEQQPQEPKLLLCLARLSLASQLWGKARQYYEQSLALKPSPEAYSELARLLAQLGEGQRSNELFHQGLLLLGQDNPPSLPLGQ